MLPAPVVHPPLTKSLQQSRIAINQLDKLKQTVTEKRPELANRKDINFHHDNAKPHITLVTK